MRRFDCQRCRRSETVAGRCLRTSIELFAEAPAAAVAAVCAAAPIHRNPARTIRPESEMSFSCRRCGHWWHRMSRYSKRHQ